MIDLLPNDDQQALADALAELLAAEAPLSRLHGDCDGDRSLLQRLTELGWTRLGLPDAGGGAVEEVLLMRGAGRHLVGPGLVATMLAARLGANAEAAALAMPVPGESGTAWRIDWRQGDATVLLARDGAALIAGDEAGAAVRAIDDTVMLERVRLPIDGGGDAALVDRATLWIGAILVGLADCARDMAVAYAKVREQFGQPIGGFQAIKHRCADMALRCEAAWSQTVFAALAMDGTRADAGFQVSAARLIAGDAAIVNARANIQVHGGIGFTDEADPHLLVRRAQLWLELGGGARHHQRALLAAPPPVAEADA